MAPLVDNPQITQSELLRPLPFFLHTYVWPFAIAWPIFFRYYLSDELYEKHIGAQEWTFVWCGAIFSVQSLFWLSTHWSVNLEGKFRASKAKNIDDAELIKIIPIANAGSPAIVKLIRDKVGYTLLLPLMPRTNPNLTGRRQGQPLVPLPEAPFPLRPRNQGLCHSPVRHRPRAQAHHRPLPDLQGYRQAGRTFAHRAALWPQHLRHSRPHLHRAVPGARRGALLRLPNLLCRSVDAR